MNGIRLQHYTVRKNFQIGRMQKILCTHLSLGMRNFENHYALCNECILYSYKVFVSCEVSCLKMDLRYITTNRL